MTLRTIPKDWKWQRLDGLVSRFDAGVSVNGGDRAASTSEFGVLKVSAVTEGTFLPEENKVIEGAELARASLNPKPNRLVMSRANTPNLVGASAYVVGEHPNLFLSDKLWQLEPHHDVDFSMRWLGFVLGSPAFRKRLGEIATGSSHSMKNISKESVMQLLVPVPPVEEQGRIAGVLDAWDTAIQKTQQMIAAKKSLLHQLRESQFQRGDRSQRTKLHTVTRESTARNGAALGRKAVMAVTKQYGMRPMREETIAANIERYKVVRPGAFAYNPMRLNIGSIAMSRFSADVLVSPDYVVFECDESKLLPGFLNHLRFCRRWTSHFQSAGNGSVRIRIYYDDLGAFTFDLPSLNEQRRIIRTLDTAVLELEKLEAYAEALNVQKRGLMQKLLTGQWRLPISKGARI